MAVDLFRLAIDITLPIHITHRPTGRLWTLAASIFKATIRTTWNGKEKRKNARCAGKKIFSRAVEKLYNSMHSVCILYGRAVEVITKSTRMEEPGVSFRRQV